MNRWALASCALLALSCGPANSEDLGGGAGLRPEANESDKSSKGEDEASEDDEDDSKGKSKKSGKKSGKSGKSGKAGKSGKSGKSGEKGDNEDPGDSSDDDDDGETPKFDLGELPKGSENQPKKGATCDIDFLFVIDNSGSMRDEQINLANSVPKFIETITKDIDNLESYHVGVISTDEDRFGKKGGANRNCAKLGGLTVERPRAKGDPVEPGGKAGMNVSCGPYANGLSFMTKADNIDEKFNCAARLGTSGDGNERPMDALFASMSPQLTAKGACNEGFFRKDAILAVVLITDEEDDVRTNPFGGKTGSKGDPKTWHKQLMKFKDNREEFLVVLSLIGHEPPNECVKTFPTGKADSMNEDGAEISPRLKEFTEHFGDRGSVYDVCAKDYSKSFAKAVNVLGSACDSLPPPK